MNDLNCVNSDFLYTVMYLINIILNLSDHNTICVNSLRPSDAYMRQ